MALIKTIEPEEAEGSLKEIYDKILDSRGKIAEVYKIQSLNPGSLENHLDLYMTVMFAGSPLKRVQREMMAVVVSAANGCEYCQVHHCEAVNHYWKDKNKTEQLRRNYTRLQLTEIDRRLCDFAWNLTKRPGAADKELFIQPLKETGLSDRAILDAALVVSYFNFVNRLVMGLGVHLKGEPGKYKY